MTIVEIQRHMKPVKPASRARVYVWLSKFNIKPVSRVRQTPQQYPDDAAEVILKNLGLTPSNGHAKKRGAR